MPTTLSEILQHIAQSRSNEELAAIIPQFDSIDPTENPSEVCFYKGLVYFRLGHADAIKHFEQSIALNSENPDAFLYYGLSISSDVTKHKALAIRRDSIKKALDLANVRHDGHAEQWVNYALSLEIYAQVCMGIGPYSEVESAYRKLLAVNANNHAYYVGLAHALIDQGKANDLSGLKAVKELFESALALNPALDRADLESVNTSIALLGSNSRPKKIGRYPDTSEMRGDISEVIKRFITNQIPSLKFINKNTKFTTMGSCFAAEISKKLRSSGFVSTHFDVSEFVNSTYANRYMVDWAVGECQGQPKERLDELFAGINLTPADLLEYWTNADVAVYTLGVAPAFFERGTSKFIMPKGSSLNARALAEKYEFRTTTVAENLENLDYIYSRIRSFNKNPGFKFVVTLSPVPLKGSFEFESAIYADCISKSTLRVVAHEFIKSHGNAVLYWPSFEIVKWLGGHIGPFYGVDDDASWHISEDLIHVITDLFIEHFSE